MNKRHENSKERKLEKEEETTFKVVLQVPETNSILWKPPRECKIIKELSPGDKNKLNFYERRKHIEALNAQKLGKKMN